MDKKRLEEQQRIADMMRLRREGVPMQKGGPEQIADPRNPNTAMNDNSTQK